MQIYLEGYMKVLGILSNKAYISQLVLKDALEQDSIFSRKV